MKRALILPAGYEMTAEDRRWLGYIDAAPVDTGHDTLVAFPGTEDRMLRWAREAGFRHIYDWRVSGPLDAREV